MKLGNILIYGFPVFSALTFELAYGTRSRFPVNMILVVPVFFNLILFFGMSRESKTRKQMESLDIYHKVFSLIASPFVYLAVCSLFYKFTWFPDSVYFSFYCAYWASVWMTTILAVGLRFQEKCL